MVRENAGNGNGKNAQTQMEDGGGGATTKTDAVHFDEVDRGHFGGENDDLHNYFPCSNPHFHTGDNFN